MQLIDFLPLHTRSLQGLSAFDTVYLALICHCACMLAGGGKSACYRSLQAAQTAIMQRQPGRKLATAVQDASDAATAGDQAEDSSSQTGVQAHVLNPKAISLAELYGSHNAVTNEWTDGLASRMIRAAVADERDTMHWVVFDGPVDAGWVESMNTGEWGTVDAVLFEGHTFTGLTAQGCGKQVAGGHRTSSETCSQLQQCVAVLTGRVLPCL